MLQPGAVNLGMLRRIQAGGLRLALDPSVQPAMAAALGPILFVIIVVGGMGSLAGALLASLLIGLLQSLAVAFDRPLGGVTLSQVAPLLPYALLVLVLAVRPRGLLGHREA